MNLPAQGATVAGPDYDKIWTSVYGDMQTRGPVHRHLHRIVSKVLDSIDYRSVLDVGCGPGHNYPLLAKGNPAVRYAGTDVSEWAIERARRQVPGTFHLGDIQQTVPEGTWDLVYSSLLLEHLQDDTSALRNMRKAAAQHVLLTTIGGDFRRYRAWDERMGHVRNYRRGELEEKARAAGFGVARAIYWGFPFYSPIARILQNHSAVGCGRFGPGARVAARALYGLYFLNSHRRGDLIVMLLKTE